MKGDKTYYSTPDSYRDYKTMSKTPIGVKEYKKIVNLFFKFLLKLILDGEAIRLPGTMGTVYIMGKKRLPRTKPDGSISGIPDWVATKKYWEKNPEAKEKKKILFHFNEHTSGIVYHFHWGKFNMSFPNSNVYSFTVNRTLGRRAMHKKITEENKEYICDIIKHL